jgi:hypothetical protein
MGVNGQLVAPVTLLQCNNPRYLLDRKEAGRLPQPVWVLQGREHVSAAGNRTLKSWAFSHCVECASLPPPPPPDSWSPLSGVRLAFHWAVSVSLLFALSRRHHERLQRPCCVVFCSCVRVTHGISVACADNWFHFVTPGLCSFPWLLVWLPVSESITSALWHRLSSWSVLNVHSVSWSI